MRYRIFLDTNILISGIFFEGNEAKILDTGDLHFFTDEVKSRFKVRKAREFLDEIEKS